MLDPKVWAVDSIPRKKMGSARVLCFTGLFPDATGVVSGCCVFVLLEGFGQFIERCVPAHFSHLALLARRKAHVPQRHPGLSTKLFKRYCHLHFHWDVRGHPVMRGRNHVPFLVGEAVRGDYPLQRNDLPIDACAPVVFAVWDRMQKRYLPPTRRSILMKGAVKPSGPHHRFARSGSVHAFHTASRGASNTRTIVSSFLFLVWLISSVLLVILFPLDVWPVG